MPETTPVDTVGRNTHSQTLEVSSTELLASLDVLRTVTKLQEWLVSNVFGGQDFPPAVADRLNALLQEEVVLFAQPSEEHATAAQAYHELRSGEGYYNWSTEQIFCFNPEPGVFLHEATHLLSDKFFGQDKTNKLPEIGLVEVVHGVGSLPNVRLNEALTVLITLLVESEARISPLTNQRPESAAKRGLLLAKSRLRTPSYQQLDASYRQVVGQVIEFFLEKHPEKLIPVLRAYVLAEPEQLEGIFGQRRLADVLTGRPGPLEEFQSLGETDLLTVQRVVRMLTQVSEGFMKPIEDSGRGGIDADLFALMRLGLKAISPSRAQFAPTYFYPSEQADFFRLEKRGELLLLGVQIDADLLGKVGRKGALLLLLWTGMQLEAAIGGAPVQRAANAREAFLKDVRVRSFLQRYPEAVNQDTLQRIAPLCWSE